VKRKAIICLAVALQIGFTVAPRTAMSQSPSTKKEVASKIQVLPEKQLEATSWRNVGFDTPQATAQTFMWALREQKLDDIKACFNYPDKMDAPGTGDDGLHEAKVAAKSFRALAIKNIDETTVDLKFEVQGWGDAALTHRLKKTKAGWKLDTDSSTREATW